MSTILFYTLYFTFNDREIQITIKMKRKKKSYWTKGNQKLKVK